MAERIPHYFGGQCPPPPPPPPPPPLNPSSQYGIATAISPSGKGSYQYSSGQPHALNNTQRSAGYGVPGLPPGLPTVPVKVTKECMKTATATITKKPSSSWSCEACKITLDSEKAFKSHRKSHVKCSDCSFEGAPKIVKAHYQAKHGKFSGSGFKTIAVGVPGCRVQRFKICVGNRPEDIQRWIEERKKKFPRTVPKNISSSKDTNSADNTTSTLLETTTTTEASTGKIQEQTSAAAGLSSLLLGYGSSDDDGSDNDNEVGKASSSKSSSNAISPIVQKGDDVGDAQHANIDGDTRSNTKIESNSKHLSNAPASSEKLRREQQNKKPRPCRFFLKGKCKNGNDCKFSHEVVEGAQQRKQQNPSQPSRAPSSTGGRNKNNIKKRKRGGHTSSDTLLRKLLQNDMERESTLSMQLLKFIVNNKFFLDEDDKTKEKRINT